MAGAWGSGAHTGMSMVGMSHLGAWGPGAHTGMSMVGMSHLGAWGPGAHTGMSAGPTLSLPPAPAPQVTLVACQLAYSKQLFGLYVEGSTSKGGQGCRV